MAVQRKSGGRPLVGGVGISSPQRVIDQASGATKIALAEYYLSVAAWLVPHLAGRPLSLVRARRRRRQRKLLPAALRPVEDAAYARAAEEP